jgi:hypothetical protein
MAHAYLAVGQQRIFLHEEKDLPWEYVTAVESNSSVIGNRIPTGINFIAQHPCGLIFHWTLDVFSRDRGYPTCALLVGEIRDSHAKLSAIGQKQLREWLLNLLPALEAEERSYREPLQKIQNSIEWLQDVQEKGIV